MLVLPAKHRLTKLARVPLHELADENVVLFPRRSGPSFFDQCTAACRARRSSQRAGARLVAIAAEIGANREALPLPAALTA